MPLEQEASDAHLLHMLVRALEYLEYYSRTSQWNPEGESIAHTGLVFYAWDWAVGDTKRQRAT